MSGLLTWEQYSSLHDGVTEEKFEGAEHKAEMIVKSVIGPRWETITEETYGYDVLLECIAEIIDAQAMNEKLGIGTGLSSVSNDGYTESYAQSSMPEVREVLHSTVRAMLSGTGLVGAY